jgi:hypothetical protein
MAKLTDKQKQIIGILQTSSLKQDRKGYYYNIPTGCRRSGKMRVQQKEIDKLIKLGLWNKQK